MNSTKDQEILEATKVGKRLASTAGQCSKTYFKLNHELLKETQAEVPQMALTDLNIIKNLWADLKRGVHARLSKNIAEQEAICEWNLNENS